MAIEVARRFERPGPKAPGPRGDARQALSPGGEPMPGAENG